MSLRYICIELRENLRCANVFLQFENNLAQIKSLKINIKSDELMIKEHGNCISFKLAEHLSLDTRTLTNLAVEKRNASFRFSITDKTDNEVLQPQSVPTKFSQVIQPLFEIGQQGSFICSICKCQIMGTDTLIRTREFPTGAVDSSEFFCHAATEFKDILVPRICDLYYGFDFIVVNFELLESSIKVKCGHVYCQRCLRHLGETLFNGKAVKLWADTLNLQLEERDNAYGEILTKLTIPKLIQKVVDDCTDSTDPLHSMNFAKVLLSTSFSDRSTKYLIIQILEKRLKVLRNETPFLYDNNCDNNNVREEQLTECKCFKMLYRFLEEYDSEHTERRLPAILQFWQQDISIQSLKISPTIFSTLLQELEENSMLIPEFYRFNKDEFKLSYVFYKDL